MMRTVLVCGVMLSAALSAAGQDDPNFVPERFRVPYSPVSYPQASAKEALASAVKALDRGKVDYVAAYLLDPAFVDARTAERAKAMEQQTDLDLRTERERQRLNPAAVRRDDRLSDDPPAFAEAVRAEARRRAFPLVVADMRGNLADNPDRLRTLRRLARDGQFEEQADTAKVTLKDLKDRAVFLRKIGPRWFVEDRTQDAPAK